MHPPAANREMVDAAADVDRILRFSPAVAERYESEHGRTREADLRRNALFGLFLYNVYNLTGWFLTPDIALLAVALRLLLFTPAALLLVWSIGRVDAAWREHLMLAGMIGGLLPPAMLFWLTQSPLGAYAFVEIILSLLFGNIVLTLRFPYAIVLTVFAFLVGLLVITAKPNLDGGLGVALLLQLMTACGCGLYANYQIEARRCRDYLLGLRARMLRDIAEHARERFQDLSQTDALTGLPNRRALDHCLDAWLAEGGPVAVVMIDIDHFKPFNDTLGHPEGDACLRRVAETLAASTFGRSDRLCARYGGEEFALVLRGADPAEVTSLAADLVSAVVALGLSHPGRRDGTRIVTISVGAAVCERRTSVGGVDAKASLLARADRALYTAKQSGRNCAVLGESQPFGLMRAG